MHTTVLSPVRDQQPMPLADQNGPIMVGLPNERAVAGWQRLRPVDSPQDRPAGVTEPLEDEHGRPMMLFTAAGRWSWS